MGFKDAFARFFKKYLYNPAWKCSVCGKEIFDGKYFCDECEKKFPFNNKYICSHCGRQTVAATTYCSTCSEVLTAIDRGRSVFTYEGAIPGLIMRLKYYNQQYLVDYFGEKLAFLYLQNYFNADYLTYVPMTERAKADRGYNQSELLAEKVSELTGVPVSHCVVKVKKTKRQAKLKRKDRLKNLEGAFKILDKASVKGKTIVIIDDVSTTGATAQAAADKLKRAGAKVVCMLSVASVPPIENY
jgi:ComF family protein